MDFVWLDLDTSVHLWTCLLILLWLLVLNWHPFQTHTNNFLSLIKTRFRYLLTLLLPQIVFKFLPLIIPKLHKWFNSCCLKVAGLSKTWLHLNFLIWMWLKLINLNDIIINCLLRKRKKNINIVKKAMRTQWEPNENPMRTQWEPLNKKLDLCENFASNPNFSKFGSN